MSLYYSTNKRVSPEVMWMLWAVEHHECTAEVKVDQRNRGHSNTKPNWTQLREPILTSCNSGFFHLFVVEWKIFNSIYVNIYYSSSKLYTAARTEVLLVQLLLQLEATAHVNVMCISHIIYYHAYFLIWLSEEVVRILSLPSPLVIIWNNQSSFLWNNNFYKENL